MATQSTILAWRIPWTEETGGLQSGWVAESDTMEGLIHFIGTVKGRVPLKIRVCAGPALP